ncbi:hypothetical protein VF04_10470 [Nostoc linckia z7]|nr:hypothetical protein VF05_15425 [Nostoc linckia z3]PHJ74257.1 hypothetical protein VF03_14565 [Nostoc linckia z2]PHJ98072.1 hypothetical protein VF04_10470 [Nostoc linckia z7]
MLNTQFWHRLGNFARCDRFPPFFKRGNFWLWLGLGQRVQRSWRNFRWAGDRVSSEIFGLAIVGFAKHILS